MQVSWARLVRGRDVGLIYALAVVIIVLVVFLRPHGDAARLVLDTSTNLDNLRSRPLQVLAASAFVLSSPWSLWILPLLVWVYGLAQRWIGRVATVLVGASGHVVATLFTALLLNAGIVHHDLSRRLAHEPDVGVSYGLAALGGLLVFRLQPGLRWKAAVVGTMIAISVLAVSQTFTDLGHLSAWSFGLMMGFVGSQLAAAGKGS